MSSFGLNNISPAVRNIIAINIAMAVLQHLFILFNFDLANVLGLHYWETPRFKVWQPLTHIFMHGSATDPSLTLRHLFFNMFGLYMFGPVLEDIWGSRRFMLF